MRFNKPALPDFYDDLDKQTHEALIERGYHYSGYHRMMRNWLYQRRFHEHEASEGDFGPEPDKCCIEVWRSDMRESFPAYEQVYRDAPVHYEVEGYYEAAEGHAGKLLLYAFPRAELMERIDALEEQVLHVWDRYSRLCRPAEEEEQDASDRD